MPSTDNWQIVPVQSGPGQFFVLVDGKGKTKAQGRKALCDCVKQSYKYEDTTAQRNERLAFYGVLR